MAPTQRRRSLHLDLPDPNSDERPPLSALFLIQFDVKAGYTIAWKRAAADLELSDSVEFKSLPSGLHNVPEDLVYFMHGDDHAGISAFVNTANDKWERNALMLAVGALVPLEHGRLGRSWKHAPALKDMAKELALDLTKTEVLEKYWQANQPSETAASLENDEALDAPDRKDSQSPASRKRKRRSRMKSMSSTFGMSASLLAPHHPALSLSRILQTFGPLIFPLYKAALLRKRILLVNEAPVELACNFVYDISILSNIPSSVWESIPLEPLPARLQPLFSIGVHDIDDLAQKGSSDVKDGALAPDGGIGWVACTTDNVLSAKSNLYDVIVSLPNSALHLTASRTWPSLKTSTGYELKASQRDFRRYKTLRQCQRRSNDLAVLVSPYPAASGDSSETAVEGPEDESSPLLSGGEGGAGADETSADEKLIEPLSWSALAYNSFIWWASAGEKRSDLDDEAERDAAMFRDYNAYVDTPGSSRSRRQSSPRPFTPATLAADGVSPPEMAIIGYFHRLTAAILGTLSIVVDTTDANVEAPAGADPTHAEDKPAVYVSGEDMARMGLDVWSDSDRRFVEELVELYWGRSATVQGGRIECCGVRIL